MNRNSILIRESDQKEFRVVFLSHWSTIVSDDGEEDSIKCYGPNMYVSATKGHGYKEKTEEG